MTGDEDSIFQLLIPCVGITQFEAPVCASLRCPGTWSPSPHPSTLSSSKASLGLILQRNTETLQYNTVQFYAMRQATNTLFNIFLTATLKKNETGKVNFNSILFNPVYQKYYC